MTMRHVCCAGIASALLAFGSVVPAFALGPVTWTGDAEAFARVEGELFDAWAGVLPGDDLTGSVVVENTSDDPIEMFVAPLGTEDMGAGGAEALAGVTLTVTTSGGDTVYSGPLAAVEEEPVSIGTFEAGDSDELTFAAHVDESLGNAAAMAAFGTQWEFSVQQIGEGDEPGVDTPGDDDGNGGGGTVTPGGGTGGGADGGGLGTTGGGTDTSGGKDLGGSYKNTGDVLAGLAPVWLGCVGVLGAACVIGARKVARDGKEEDGDGSC